MRSHVPAQVMKAYDATKQARQLITDGQYKEAEPILRGIRDEARSAGWGHASISHHLSYALFRLDRFEEALECECEAVAQEPFNIDYHKAFDSLVQRMREVIEAADLSPDDPRIPRFHALLVREVEETTVETHLALLRHLCAVGNHAEAERFSKALSLLHPEHPEVWRYRAGIEADSGTPADERSGSLAILSFLPAVVGQA